MVIVYCMAMHQVSDFIDSIKESITDAQYKQGMDMCKEIFEQKESETKVYRMTFLRPYTFMDNHCEDHHCQNFKLLVSFVKTESLVRLDKKRYEEILESNLFLGSIREMKDFIDIEVLRSFPTDQEDLGTELEWYEFPVLNLVELEDDMAG